MREKNLMNTNNFDALLSGQRQRVVSLVPLSERRGVNLHDRALCERLRTNQLVVASIVDNIDDSCLSGNAYFFFLNKKDRLEK